MATIGNLARASWGLPERSHEKVACIPSRHVRSRVLASGGISSLRPVEWDRTPGDGNHLRGDVLGCVVRGSQLVGRITAWPSQTSSAMLRLPERFSPTPTTSSAPTGVLAGGRGTMAEWATAEPNPRQSERYKASMSARLRELCHRGITWFIT
jgi:hypothetical protein